MLALSNSVAASSDAGHRPMHPMSCTRSSPVDQLAAGVELPEFFHYLGMSVVKAAADEAVVRMQVPKGLLSPYGPVHGGAIAALIDTTIGVAVACRMPHGARTATHELNINYISFSKEPVVIATARVHPPRPHRGALRV